MTPSPWWCQNCTAVRDLDKHARCSCCGSDAVDIAVRPPVTLHGLGSAYIAVDELERTMQCSAENERCLLER